MKIQNAIDYVREFLQYSYHEELEIALDCMERDVVLNPAKFYRVVDFCAKPIYVCQVCEKEIDVKNHTYCPYCGQKLFEIKNKEVT